MSAEPAEPTAPGPAEPVEPQLAAPTEPELGVPREPELAAPAEPVFAAPVVSEFAAPAEPVFAAPAVSELAVPAEPELVGPAEPELGGPAAADGEPPNPAEFDVTRPNAARMYDYFLGGAHNLAIDRELADKTIAIMPGIVATARANRSFLQRAVQYCMKAGIRQYLDLGSGIPTVGHVHEVAHRIDRAARVAYVDIEPVAVAQTKRLLADVPTASVTKADITDPKQVLAAPGVAELLDFSQPVAIVACAVFHFVPEVADPVGVLANYRDHLSPGGALVFSHGASSLPPEQSEQLHALYKQTTQPLHRRTQADIEAMLAGWELVEPGLVDVAAWRPEHTPDAGPATIWAAVGRRV